MRENRPVNTLPEALVVRKLRNQCRTHLTNHADHIDVPGQTDWYTDYYKEAAASGEYRIFVTYEDEEPVGYGALRLGDGQLYVTECVAEGHRGKGYGRVILENLISIADEEELPLVAEIWATNKASIALHEKCGFVLDADESGQTLCVYRKDN